MLYGSYLLVGERNPRINFICSWRKSLFIKTQLYNCCIYCLIVFVLITNPKVAVINQNFLSTNLGSKKTRICFAILQIHEIVKPKSKSKVKSKVKSKSQVQCQVQKSSPKSEVLSLESRTQFSILHSFLHYLNRVFTL